MSIKSAALALVRREEAPARPALATLRAHLEQRGIAQKQIEAEHALSAQRAAAQAEIAKIDETIAVLVYDRDHRGTTVDLVPLQRARGKAEAALAGLTPVAGTVEALSNVIRRLDGETPALVHAVLLEQLTALAPEFQQAEKALRSVHARVFARAIAADQLAKGLALGSFVTNGTEGNFTDLMISRPALPGFAWWPVDPGESARTRTDVALAVEKASQELVGRLLSGETTDA